MADKSILALSPVASLTGNEQVPVVQGGATKRASVADWTAALSASFAPYNATVNGVNSINGGGTIGSGVTLQLANDSAAPGAGKVYGTDGAGQRGWQNATNGGTVLQVDTGVGLTGGPITASGTIALANTAVVAGAYGSATQSVSLQVDAQGRLVSAGNVTVTPAWASVTGTPTTLAGYGITDAVPSIRTITAGTGLTGGGALSSDISIALSDTVVGAGPIGNATTVPVITFNNKGQLTAVTTATISATPTSRTITAGTGLTGGGDLTADRTISLATPVALANGGTNASIAASNGGIVWSNATQLQVLAGTATAGQILRSGASAAPSWSTATFPATTTINELLYSSAGNVVAGLATVAAGVLTTSSSVPTWATVLSGGLGGTNNQFMQFSGPASTIKTYTLPNSSVTLAALQTVQSFTVAQRGTAVALTDAATVAVDLALANNFTLTIAGNRTLGAPTNQVVGQSGCIVITQDGGGGRTLAYNSAWKFPGGTVPTLTTTGGAVDVLTYYVESASRITAQLLNDVK